MSVTQTNFLQGSGFRIVINRERFANLEYFVQTVNHPSVDVPEAAGSFRHLSQLQQIGDKLEFAPVTFTIMLDEEMAAYTEMYTWMKNIVEQNYTSTTNANTESLSSEHDISLLIMNSSNVLQKTIVYKNAFPVSLGEISMESTASDITIITVPVTFRYTYFELL